VVATDPPPVAFRPASELQATAAAVLERERARLASLLALVPGTELVLTGASSLPDLLTAGDIDLHLRVPAAAWEDVVPMLRETYAVVLPEIWQPGFATFEVPGADPPVGIAVTAIDGEHDRRFRAAWARLAADPAERARYNELKRTWAGGSESDYRAAKSAFFDRLAE
jgi:GrpB-like predicted nucleotidyltransferase (UPF0157 family)